MPWRGVVLILGALVFFGATIRGLGLVPALFGAGLRSARSPAGTNGPSRPLLLAAALTLLCVLIFHFGLGIPVPLVGPWLRF